MFVQSPLPFGRSCALNSAAARASYHTAVVTVQLAVLGALELLQLRQPNAENTGKEITPSLKCWEYCFQVKLQNTVSMIVRCIRIFTHSRNFYLEHMCESTASLRWSRCWSRIKSKWEHVPPEVRVEGSISFSWGNAELRTGWHLD